MRNETNMMYDNLQEVYETRLKKYQKEQQKNNNHLRLFGLLRLISFLSAMLTFMVLYRNHIWIALFVSCLLFGIFIFLVKLYINRKNKGQYISNLIRVNQTEINALQYNLQGIETGDEYIDKSHCFSYDLDLFGEGSLFQYLNRTCTFIGKVKLKDWLLATKTDPSVVLDRQEAIQELMKDVDFRQDFLAKGLTFKEGRKDKERLIKWLAQENDEKEMRLLKIMTTALIVLFLLALIMNVFNIFPGSIVLIFAVINLFTVGSKVRKTNRIHLLLSKQYNVLTKYAILLDVIGSGKYNSYHLNSITKSLDDEKDNASKSIKNLSRIISSFDFRLNMLAGFMLNAFLLWDFICLIRLDRWKKIHKKEIISWLDIISEFDVLVTLSNFAFNHSNFTFPVYSQDLIIEAQDLGHPQIPQERRINNDIEIQRKGCFIIITGPNMAGKSTWLRTVGVNLVLANMGSVVCAGRFNYAGVVPYTNMRTTDSLAKSESYFFAELKRLKAIINELEKHSEIFILLDEILKGTNSIDKQKGSKMFLEKIIRLKGCGIIATHDLSLSETKNDYPGQIKNQCFEIEIEGTDIIYDYKIRDGVTTRMNASFLMKQLGVVNE